MVERLVRRLFNEWRPEEGWLPLILLIAIASTVVTAVIEANWVPEGGVVFWTVSVGLFLTIGLAKRPVSWFFAAPIIAAYGIMLTILNLAQLRPPLAVLFEGPSSTLTYIRQNLVLFADRIGGWLTAVSGGGSSNETVVFALGLGLISWLLIAYLGWTTYRHHNPLNALVLIGIALGFNAVYGDTSPWPLAVFIGLSVLLLSNIHMVDMHQLWNQRLVDYPSGISVELYLTGGGIALGLLVVSFVVPAVNIREIRAALLERQSIQEAEQAFERAFGGVNISPALALQQELERSRSRGGDMPRSFLLGNPPELSERLVMTTTVQGEAAAPGANWPLHWRSFSYDIYTGRGWNISSERTEDFNAGERLPIPEIESPRILSQSVHWVLPSTRTRYSLGLPLRFDQFVTAHWRGLSDLTQVRGGGSTYTVETQVTNATPAELRQTTIANVPDTILARYTGLPVDLPERVIELAREAAGGATNPYDRVKSIEGFLRQYPYSLDVNLPPANQDLVDYFLFDLQIGYCDYYATSMVVMARSLGVPARFATGFLAQRPNEDGVQEIYAINAHSWAEVYFAGYGWVEFEPTAAFPSQSQLEPSSDALLNPPDFPAGEVLELPPPPEPESPSLLTNPNFLLVLILFLAGVGVLIWLAVGARGEGDAVLQAYGRLQHSANRLGQPTPKSQTPIEFSAAFEQRVGQLAQKSKLASRLIQARADPVKKRAALPDDAAQLRDLFMVRQYSRPDEPTDESVVEPEGENKASITAAIIWERIRLRLWLLAIIGRLRRLL